MVVVRDDTMAAARQVGIGLGDLDHCADSLTFAFEEAALRQASLTVLHALQSDISRAGPSFTAAGWHDDEVHRQLVDLPGLWSSVGMPAKPAWPVPVRSRMRC